MFTIILQDITFFEDLGKYKLHNPVASPGHTSLHFDALVSSLFYFKPADIRDEPKRALHSNQYRSCVLSGVESLSIWVSTRFHEIGIPLPFPTNKGAQDCYMCKH